MTNLEGVKPKRGRKSKKDIEAAAAAAAAAATNTSISISIEEKSNSTEEFSNLQDNLNINDNANIILFSKFETEVNLNDDNVAIKPGAKKRGRKPKGGKIIQQIVPANVVKEEKPNIILHLKCSIKDLQAQNMFDLSLEPYHFSNNKNELNYDLLGDGNASNFNNKNQPMFNEQKITTTILNNASEESNNYDYDSETEKEVESKQVWKKLKQLEHNLHINNINDKKSACFWCTYEFDNPPVYIPKHYIKDSYQVYGCFCSPECAVAHLMEENIDSSTKFERYHLLNHIYAKVYDYKKNIKPAPNAYYMLDKYYGNLSIQEYRSLLRNERFFLIVDKPLTRILPELHEDNEDHIINNKIIPSNNFHIKKKLQRKPQSKNNILNEKFGMQNAISE
jgi:hypothetical protein